MHLEHSYVPPFIRVMNFHSLRKTAPPNQQSLRFDRFLDSDMRVLQPKGTLICEPPRPLSNIPLSPDHLPEWRNNAHNANIQSRFTSDEKDLLEVPHFAPCQSESTPNIQITVIRVLTTKSANCPANISTTVTGAS